LQERLPQGSRGDASSARRPPEALAPRDYVRKTDELGLRIIETQGSQASLWQYRSQTYLYPATAKAGVFRSVEKRNGTGKLVVRYFDLSGNPVRRWGFHNFRHSLASWLVSEGVDVKTVSSMLRHSSTRPTLDIYSHAVGPNQLAAQGQFMDALKCHGAVQ
jgi:integrase